MSGFLKYHRLWCICCWQISLLIRSWQSWVWSTTHITPCHHCYQLKCTFLQWFVHKSSIDTIIKPYQVLLAWWRSQVLELASAHACILFRHLLFIHDNYYYYIVLQYLFAEGYPKTNSLIWTHGRHWVNNTVTTCYRS